MKTEQEMEETIKGWKEYGLAMSTDAKKAERANKRAHIELNEQMKLIKKMRDAETEEILILIKEIAELKHQLSGFKVSNSTEEK